MIDVLILIGAGGIIAVLAIIAYLAIVDSNRQARKKDAAIRDAEGAQRELEVAIAGKEALKAENADLYLRIKARDEMITRLAQENEFKQKTIDHLSVKVDEIRAQNRDLEEINSDLIKVQAAMRAQLAEQATVRTQTAEQRKTVPIKRVRKDTQAHQQEEA